MYRLVGFGTAPSCSIPGECIQAVKRYPERINTSLVDDYCTWEAQGKGGQVEKLCLKALAEGEKAAQEAEGEKPCVTNEDCASGLCDQGWCTLAYPYGAWSEDTLQGQIAVNAFRTKQGLPTLKENGVLGTETCAAWSQLCDQRFSEAQKDDPFAVKPDYIVDKTTWYAVPCFASGCKETERSKAAMWGIGIGVLGIVGALVYYRSRRAT